MGIEAEYDGAAGYVQASNRLCTKPGHRVDEIWTGERRTVSRILVQGWTGLTLLTQRRAEKEGRLRARGHVGCPATIGLKQVGRGIIIAGGLV